MKELGFGNGSFLEHQWSLIKTYIEDNDVRILLEIGCGFSTIMFSKINNLKVLSLENNKYWAERIRERVLYTDTHIIEYVYPQFPLLDDNIDLCFIDGPANSGNGRSDSMIYCMNKCNKLFIHDSRRHDEKKNINHLFNHKNGWKQTIYRNGLSLIENEKSNIH